MTTRIDALSHEHTTTTTLRESTAHARDAFSAAKASGGMCRAGWSISSAISQYLHRGWVTEDAARRSIVSLGV
jgi:hypothetical protein